MLVYTLYMQTKKQKLIKLKLLLKNICKDYISYILQNTTFLAILGLNIKEFVSKIHH